MAILLGDDGDAPAWVGVLMGVAFVVLFGLAFVWSAEQPDWSERRAATQQAQEIER